MPYSGLSTRAGHVGDDVVHRQQVLVVQRLLAQRVAHRDQFADRHQLAGGAAHRQLQQRVEIALRLGRQLQQRRRRVLALRRAGRPWPRRPGRRAACSRSRSAARRASPPCAGRPAAACCGAAAMLLSSTSTTPGVCSNTRAHRLGDLAAAFGLGPVDLGDDRRQHRRAGRHFDHLDVGAEAPADRLQRRGAAAWRWRGSVRCAACLSTRFTCRSPTSPPRAQVVLAHQAVEVDRRGGAGVGLVVGDLGLARPGGRRARAAPPRSAPPACRPACRR